MVRSGRAVIARMVGLRKQFYFSSMTLLRRRNNIYSYVNKFCCPTPRTRLTSDLHRCWRLPQPPLSDVGQSSRRTTTASSRTIISYRTVFNGSSRFPLAHRRRRRSQTLVAFFSTCAPRTWSVDVVLKLRRVGRLRRQSALSRGRRCRRFGAPIRPGNANPRHRGPLGCPVNAKHVFESYAEKVRPPTTSEYPIRNIFENNVCAFRKIGRLSYAFDAVCYLRRHAVYLLDSVRKRAWRLRARHVRPRQAVHVSLAPFK